MTDARPAPSTRRPASRGLSCAAMSRIVTYAHRHKRPPRKKAKAAAITGPAVDTVPTGSNFGFH